MPTDLAAVYARKRETQRQKQKERQADLTTISVGIIICLVMLVLVLVDKSYAQAMEELMDLFLKASYSAFLAKSGSLAMLTAIRCASSLVSSLVAERRRGLSLK